MEKVKTIARTICKIGQVNLKVFIIINGGDNKNKLNADFKKPIRKWISRTNFATITYDVTPIIQLDYSDYNNYENGRKINLLPFYLGKFIKFLKKTLKVIEDYEGDLYAINTNGILTMPYIPTKEELNKYINIYDGFNGSNFIRSLPTIIEDKQGNTYEGIEFQVNKKENSFKLSYDELLGMIYLLDHTDFINLSQSMLLSHLLWVNDTSQLDLYVNSEFNDIERKTQWKNNMNAEMISKRNQSDSIVKSPFDGLKTI